MDVSSQLNKFNDELGNIKRADKMRGSRIPQRWVLTVMGCLAMSNMFMMRACLSITITGMVKPTENTVSKDTTVPHGTCPTFSSTLTNSSASRGGTYEWDEYTQGIILSSFYWGYTITQIPGGFLAERFGGKYTLGLGVLSTSIFTLLTPKVVQVFDSTGLIVVRFVMGLGEGSTFPAVSELIAQWAPASERTRMFTIVMSGMTLGTVVGNSLSGVIMQHSSVGWPMVYYAFGVFSALWFVAWVLLCYSYPDAHPFISAKEKEYLQVSMGEHTHRKKQPTPWRHMLTSRPVWALIAGNVGSSWGIFAIMADLPKYMSNVLKFSIETNGFLSALPHVMMWVFGNSSSWLADWLIEKGIASRTSVRRNMSTAGSLLSAIFLIAASYAGCDRTLVVTFFLLAVGMMGLFYPSVMVNPNDLSPNYSGTLNAIACVTGALTGIGAPYVAGVLTPNQALSEWRTVFWIIFFIICLPALVFHVWADGEIQYWNNLETLPDEVQSEGESQLLKTSTKNERIFAKAENEGN